MALLYALSSRAPSCVRRNRGAACEVADLRHLTQAGRTASGRHTSLALSTIRASGEIVRGGEVGGGRAVVHAELVVDRAQVLADRARREVEPLGDLGVGEAA